MFWAKIWMFILAVIAGVALTLALIMARPGERAAVKNESVKLKQACSIANILFKDNARQRVQLAGEYARIAAPNSSLNLGSILSAASKGEIVSADSNATARQALNKIFETKDDKKKADFPAFLMLLDRQGRVVARWSKEGKGVDKFGESMRGYHLVDEAIAGFMLDDLWILEGTLYRVSGSPVVGPRDEWAGAVVIGFRNDKDFATELAAELGVNVNFYLGNEALAASKPIQIHKEVGSAAAGLSEIDDGQDCAKFAPFTATAGGTSYSVSLSRLPGEAGNRGAFFAVFAEQAQTRGFMGTFRQLTKNDLSFSSFPWVLVGLAFLLMVGVGMFVLVWEMDRPLRRLGADSVQLAKAEQERLNEAAHKGKFGSVARSVNVALDKLRREAKNAQQNLDQLLGPAPGGEVLPSAAPMGFDAPPPPPPPSQFQFSGGGPIPAAPAPAPAPMPGTPHAPAVAGHDFDIPAAPPPPAPVNTQIPTQQQVPPRPVSLPLGGAEERTPPPVPRAPVVAAIDDDILGGAGKAAKLPPVPDEMPTIISDQSQNIADKDSEATYFREIFDEFIATKQRCGEDSSKLTYEKFASKLRKNREALIAKHGCKSVKFQVYVKAGKAALKASPVRG